MIGLYMLMPIVSANVASADPHIAHLDWAFRGCMGKQVSRAGDIKTLRAHGKHLEQCNEQQKVCSCHAVAAE